MLQSMTGYGRGEASRSDLTVVVELKSVNNRFLDLNLRCPREYMPLEPRIANLLKQPFTRGRIDAFVRRSVAGSSQQVVADNALALEYAKVISELSLVVGSAASGEVPLSFILGQPGVLSVTEAPVDVSGEWSIVEVALNAAVQDLLDMRAAEGEAMARDFRQNLDDMRTRIGEIEAVSKGLNERLQARLEARIKRLVTERLDPYRVAQEIAIMADKADVNEELMRLRSHCDQFDEALIAPDPVGRRLDFLLQEMNREVNTIGSKAAEHPISQRVVDLKTTLERMREMSANVE